MTKQGINLTSDDLNTNESKNVAPEVIVNTMNDGLDPSYLSQYIDCEFLDSSPDALALSAEQLELERKEKLDLDELNEETQRLGESEDDQSKAILCPREYQYELYQRALTDNVIAVLNTGSGKTLIAVMLLKQMAIQEKFDRLQRKETKLTFFLVDRVPLVFQQSNVIRANCDVEVKHMCGQMDVDNWSKQKWKELFEEADVCVMTAQIFLDTLRHGFIHMRQVNLLIFDECHHGTKRHPYNVIMREFYDPCPPEDRPRIFGMTASPMNSSSGIQFSATQLEQNLCSRIHTATDLDAMAAILHPPKEVSIAYLPSPHLSDTALTAKIRQRLGYIDRYQLCFRRVTQIMKDLGPWCADALWKYILLDLGDKLKVSTDDMDKANMVLADQALKECVEIVNENAVPDAPPKTLEWFTPKMLRLFDILKVYQTKAIQDQFCGIIFVETRHTAKAIQLSIESNPDLHALKCDVLVGHGGREEGDITMGFRDQNRIIDSFRKGTLNLIISTNVAEEGLDIQPCNSVIRFDFMTTPIGYIQSRGRARKENSTFIIMMEESNHSQPGMLEHFRQLEEGMREFCQMLPEDRNVAAKFVNGQDMYDRAYDRSEDDDDEDYLQDSYTVPSTNAVVTKQSAVSLLYRYTGSLPSDRFTALQPTFEITSHTSEGYTCTVRLPSNAAVTQVTSAVCRSKLQAKKLAAVNCCKELHLKKALTDHLLPINYKREILGNMEAVLDENGVVVGSRRRKAIYPKKLPSFWKRHRHRRWELEDDKEGEEGEGETGLLNVETEKDLLLAAKPLAPPPAVMKYTEANGDNAGSMSSESTALPVKFTNGDVAPSINGNGSEVSLLDIITDGIASDNGNSLTCTKDKNEKKEEEEEEEEIPLEDTDGPFTLWPSVIEVSIERNELDGIPLRRLCMLTWRQFPTLPDLKLFTRGTPFFVKIMPYTAEPLSVSKDHIMLLKKFNLLMASSITNREFACALGDFPYFLAPIILNTTDMPAHSESPERLNNLLDWDEIRQSLDKELTKLDLENLGSLYDTILVDYADNSRRYFVNRVCGELTPSSPIQTKEAVREIGFDHLADFYQKTFDVKVTHWDQPIVNVRKISKVMNYLSPGTVVEPKTRKSTAAFVIPEFCQRFFVSASVFQTWMIVPSIMTRVDAFLSSQEARKRYQLMIDDDNMLEAYTTPSANMEMDYERLETLGDSFLKFVATIRLYTNFPFSDEGALHCLRIRVICNRALYRAAKRLKIFRYVNSHTFNRRYWRPHGFVAATDTENTLKDAQQHSLSDKTLADIVEASLGAAFISGGLEAGLQCAIAMQIPFDDIQTWSDFWPAYLTSRATLPPRAEITALRTVDLVKIREISGYTFEMPLLVVEALTHASLPNSTAPCYQRLEFLGDAILDFLVIRYLYEKYPEADPGQITDLKDSCVNNHVLGIVCIENLLHHHIIHYSGVLIRDIQDAVNQIGAIKENKQDIGEYWLSLNIPKVLSDVVESMLGAVFVDSKFDLAAVQKLFELWLVPLLDIHVTPELVQVHPVNRFITKLQRLGCDGFMLRNVTTSSTASNGQRCVIFLHDKPFATGASDNIKVARREAAVRALDRLENEPDILERVCNCGVIRERKLEQKLLAEENLEENYF